MKNLAAGVLGLNYKNSSSHNFLLDLEVKDPDTSPNFFLGGAPLKKNVRAILREGQETSYFSGLLNHYTSSEGLLEDFAEIEKISDHMKKHEKPLGETEFGYYLAGLIEGGGNFADQ
jgi:hypothetical protein